MFFKKKTTESIKAIKYTIYDIEYSELWDAVSYTREALFSAVNKALISNIAVTIYPEGDDRNHAIKTAETTKQAVLEKISAYERVLDKLHRYYNENKTNLKKYNEWIPDHLQNAHDLVENEVRRFYAQGR